MVKKEIFYKLISVHSHNCYIQNVSTFFPPSIVILDSTPIQLWFNIFFVVALVRAVKRIIVLFVLRNSYEQ